MLLPAWEMCVYGVLAVGSHLYAFYEVHQVSQSKFVMRACSLLQCFLPVAGEAAGLDLFSLGWLLTLLFCKVCLCSSWLQTSPVQGNGSPVPAGRRAFPKAFLPLALGGPLAMVSWHSTVREEMRETSEA